MEKAYIIVPSINKLDNLRYFEASLKEYDSKVIVIDEGDEKIRRKNREILSSTLHEFYGPKERREFFRKSFSTSWRKHEKVIPKKCHAETSFGLMMAYIEKPDLVMMIDDDVFPVSPSFIDHHIENIKDGSELTVASRGKWYNTLENLELNVEDKIFPRGHPYAPEVRSEKYYWSNKKRRAETVLNMGLWHGHPDLDALTILYCGGLDGRCHIRGEKCRRKGVSLAKGSYFAVCSMNVAFLPKLIPAYYQLYMNYGNIDRFDDIWSGIFLKKIVDELGDNMRLGEPAVYHDKRPRNVFRDLKMEVTGMAINEKLWTIVDSLELEGKSYFETYGSLVEGLEENTFQFENETHEKFMLTQTQKMRLWLDTLDKIS